MTATADRYDVPYVSQMLKEPDRTWDDCCASVTIMLGADWTLGEWLERDDGRERDPLLLRNLIRKRIGDTDGGLTLHDANDMLHELDPELPDLPRYGGQAAKPGQSTAGATLRLDRKELRALLINGHSAAICGLSGTVGHVIHASRANDTGPLIKDPLTRHQPGWNGERWTWARLWAFTEAERGGKRAYGSPDAIACAVVRIGAETAAERVERKSLVAAAKANQRLADQKAQTKLATDERDAARTEARLAQQTADELRVALTEAGRRITELENATPPDCTAAIAQATEAEHARMVALVESEATELVADLVGRLR